MTKAVSFAFAFSLILAAAGCQTLNDNQNKSVKPDSNTDLSVAEAFLEGGRPDKAMYELRTLLEREPRNAKAHTLMGLSQLALKNPRKAIEHLENAWKLEAKPEHALNLSSAYLENNQLESAQKIIVAGLSLKEKPAYRNKERFYHNLGLIAERKGSLVAAEKSYKRALEENPTFYLSRARLAQILEEKKKFDQAKDHWEMARSSCPGCFEAVERLSSYYRNKGNIRTALGLVKDYRRIEGLNPGESKKAAELEQDLKNEMTKSASNRTSENNKDIER
jgi:Tfp pilus assembly protein PilF